MKMHQAALAPPERSRSLKTSVRTTISSQNHATSSMNQKVATNTSHKPIVTPKLGRRPAGAGQDPVRISGQRLPAAGPGHHLNRVIGSAGLETERPGDEAV